MVVLSREKTLLPQRAWNSRIRGGKNSSRCSFIFLLQFLYHNKMDLAAPTVENAGQMVKDELAEKCQKLFQAFLEE